MDIHPKFSHWLSLAKITPGDETIRKWWAALDGFTPDRNDVVTLVGRAGQLDPKTIKDTRFLPAIQQADAAFLPTHKMGLAVLAATKLHVMIEKDDTLLDDFAKLLTAVAFPAFEKQPAFLDDLSALAESKFSDWSRDRAEWSLVQATYVLEPKLDDLRRVVAVSAEETNMLWWLFGGRSRDLDVLFSEVSADSIGLLAAKELADLTTLLPGPPSIKAIADRAIQQGRPKFVGPLLLAQSIRSLPDTWKTAFGTNWAARPYLPLCRVAHAISDCTNITAAKWPGVFADLTGWSKDHKLPAATLANLFYRECLVPRAWQHAGT
jgi:hypothetical protein